MAGHRTERFATKHEPAQQDSEDQVVGQIVDHHLGQESRLGTHNTDHLQSRCEVAKGVDEAQGDEVLGFHAEDESVATQRPIVLENVVDYEGA